MKFTETTNKYIIEIQDGDSHNLKRLIDAKFHEITALASILNRVEK